MSNLYLKESLHKQFKAVADRLGLKLKKATHQAILEWLKEKEKQDGIG